MRELPSPLPWSYSKLSCWDDCKKRYWYRYVEKVPEVKGKGMERGNTIHKLCEEYVDGVLAREKFVAKLAELRVGPNSYLVKIADKFKEGKERGCSITTETKFKFDDDYTTVKCDGNHFGTVIYDVLVLNKDSIEIYDYKTGGIYECSHDYQGAIYAMVANKMFETIPKVVFVYADKDEQKVFKYTEQDMEDVELLVISTLEAIMAEVDFDESLGPHCNWCSYKTICRGK